MHSTSISIAIIIALALIHFSYVDFRFRYRDGVKWFWPLNPAPPLMWAARATIVVALLVTLTIPFVGISVTYGYVLGALVLLHILCLILLEVLEPR